MEVKRENADLIPYKIVDGKIFVFLQMRDKNAKILPGHYSFFGGKGELNETPEETLKREIKEELNFIVEDVAFLGKYTSVVDHETKFNVYFTKVHGNFENEIVVSEGEYGKFLSEEEIEKEQMLIEGDKKVIRDLYNRLKSNE